MSTPTTILIADDDLDIRTILRSHLESSGFQVLEAADGDMALEMVRTRNPDLLILDYTMPKMDGVLACKVLKQDLLLRHLPIIMLTGRSDLRDKVQGIRAGADDYLVKPFEMGELVARVRALMRRAASPIAERAAQAAPIPYLILIRPPGTPCPATVVPAPRIAAMLRGGGGCDRSGAPRREGLAPRILRRSWATATVGGQCRHHAGARVRPSGDSAFPRRLLRVLRASSPFRVILSSSSLTNSSCSSS